jgi:WD40 repeat protein
MLETIRQFAEEQLAAHGEATEVRTAHAGYFAGREAEIMALWDSPRQREAYTWFTVEVDAVMSVAFTPDGRRLATASYDQTVRFWSGEVTPQALYAKHTTNMSRKQWREWVSPDIPYTKICEELPIPPDEPEDT